MVWHTLHWSSNSPAIFPLSVSTVKFQVRSVRGLRQTLPAVVLRTPHFGRLSFLFPRPRPPPPVRCTPLCPTNAVDSVPFRGVPAGFSLPASVLWTGRPVRAVGLPSALTLALALASALASGLRWRPCLFFYFSGKSKDISCAVLALAWVVQCFTECVHHSMMGRRRNPVYQVRRPKDRTGGKQGEGGGWSVWCAGQL